MWCLLFVYSKYFKKGTELKWFADHISEVQSPRDLFSGVTNHSFPVNEPGFGSLAVISRKALDLLHYFKYKVCCRGDYGVELSFRNGFQHLRSSERNFQCFWVVRHFEQLYAADLVEAVCSWCIRSKVHKDINEPVKFGRAWVSCRGPAS